MAQVCSWLPWYQRGGHFRQAEFRLPILVIRRRDSPGSPRKSPCRNLQQRVKYSVDNLLDHIPVRKNVFHLCFENQRGNHGLQRLDSNYSTDRILTLTCFPQYVDESLFVTWSSHGGI